MRFLTLGGTCRQVGNFAGILVTVFLFGCVAAVVEPASAPPTVAATLKPSQTAVIPTRVTLSPLPPTTTTEATPSVAPLATKTAVSIPSPTKTPTLTATFAAYNIAHTIGFSALGHPIVAHRFGFGRSVVVIVGGMHGGYEWNTIELSYRLIDHFSENVDQIPSTVTLYVIPSANPDGQLLVTGRTGRFGEADIAVDTSPGRFNGSGVDLNRNWGCNWEAVGYWGDREVDGGERPFSEPESRALSRFLLRQRAAVVVFLHSAAEGVYPGGCPDPLPETVTLAETYSDASGYPLYEQFTSYPITGDASDWLALQNVPSFAVELKSHDDSEFEQNLFGVLALLDWLKR